MKWEYDEHHEGQEGDTLREMGAAGWEAYATDVGNYNKRITLLKRRIDEPATIDYKALAQAGLDALVGASDPSIALVQVRGLLTGVLTGAIKNAVGAVNGVAMQDIVLGFVKAHGKAQGDAMRGGK